MRRGVKLFLSNAKNNHITQKGAGQDGAIPTD